MNYRVSISTPANTAETEKTQTDIILTVGTIHQVDIVFPGGCAQLLHVQIFNGGHQVWPTNTDESFASDGDKVSFKERYKIKHGYGTISIYTWNEDDTYAHGVIIRLALLRQSELDPESASWIQRLKGFVGGQ